MNHTKIILASQSPRRRELMERTGLDFEIITSEIEEKTTEKQPDKVVQELSYMKALDVLNRMRSQQPSQSVLVVGADTVVSVGGEILGKPKTPEEAFSMISEIQGATHEVYTGVSLLRYQKENGKVASKVFSECTEVTVYPMTEDEISRYIATGDCMDKAGAYGIQGDFGVYVEKINGDYNNVVGLPVARLYHELKDFME